MSHSIDRFKLLEKTIRISNSTVDIELRLKNLLRLLKRELAVDGMFLFNFDQESEKLVLRTTGENGDAPDLVLDMEDHFIGRAVTRRERTQATAETIRELPAPAVRLFSEYESAIVFPITDDQLLYGVLIILTGTEAGIDPQHIELLETIAREIAGTIRNSRLYAESKKRIAVLSVLYEVGRALSSTIDLDHMLKTIANITCKVLQAEGCGINVLDETMDRLLVTTEYGDIPKEYRFQDLIASHQAHLPPEFANCIGQKTPYIGAGGQGNTAAQDHTLSVMCLPLTFKGSFKGCLSVFNKRPLSRNGQVEYNPEHLELLTTMGTMISSSIENALTFRNVNTLARDNELLVRSLSCLYKISGTMMTTVKTEELLAIITNALIWDQGLGFDRALILLMSEEEDCLLGAAFKEIRPEDRGDRSSSLDDLLGKCTAGSIICGNVENDFLNLKLCLDRSEGMLVQSALEKKAYVINPQDEHPLATPALPHEFGRFYCIAAPMLAKGKVVGVIAVDRDFSRIPATDDDIRNLTMLANQAGLAIENSRLYEYIEQAKQTLSQTRERLLEAEKLAALGEMAAGMAHEIRNPLVSIGGFTRRLLKNSGDDPQQRFYVEVIIKEVARLEKTLGEILNFSRDTLGHLQEYDINEMVRGSLHILRRDFKDANIEVKKDLSEPLPKIVADERQIKHVFFNLFYNASQAMPKGGHLTIKTYATRENDQEYVACEVTDTGPGIPLDVLPNIFNPFFTTKDAGTGLGLSIVHKIIRRHHGEIDVLNRPDRTGASFVVKLPVAAKPGLYLK